MTLNGRPFEPYVNLQCRWHRILWEWEKIARSKSLQVAPVGKATIPEGGRDPNSLLCRQRTKSLCNSNYSQKTFTSQEFGDLTTINHYFNYSAALYSHTIPLDHSAPSASTLSLFFSFSLLN